MVRTPDPSNGPLMALLRRLDQRLNRAERSILALSTAPQLANSAIEYGGGIDVVDPASGGVTARLGTQTDGTFGAVTLDGPIPPAPSVPLLAPAPGILTVTWDGTRAGGLPAPLDHYAVEVYVAPTPFAYIEDAVLVAALVGADGDQATVAVAPGTWHVALVAVSTALRRSPVSALATAEVSAPLSSEDVTLANGRVTISEDEPTAGDIEGKPDGALWQQVVDDVLTGAWRLDLSGPEWRPIELSPDTPYFPKVDLGSGTVGLLEGDRLAFDAIDGKVVTGATFRTSPTVGPLLGGAGIVIDSDGMHVYDGTVGPAAHVADIDAGTGEAFFTKLRARSIDSDSLLVNVSGNLVPDQEYASMRLASSSHPGWAAENFYTANPGNLEGTTPSGRNVWFRGVIEFSPTGRRIFSPSMTVSPGETLSLGIRWGGQGSSAWTAARAFRLHAQWKLADGSTVVTNGPAGVAKLANAWQAIAYDVVVPADAVQLRLVLTDGVTPTSVGTLLLPFYIEKPTVTRALLAEQRATSAQVIAEIDELRAVTPAALAAWRNAQFRVAYKTSNQAIAASGQVLSGLQLFAPRAGRAKVSISCVSYSSNVADLVQYQILRNTVDSKGGAQPANSSPTTIGTGHMFEMTAILDLAANDSITVRAARALGSGNITIAAEAANPCTLTIEYV